MAPTGILIPAAGVVLVALALWLAARERGDGARCGPGFAVSGDHCVGCAPPLAWTNEGCNAPDVPIDIPETTALLGPSDWEAEGRVAPRTLHVLPFRIDAFEATLGAWKPETMGQDRARAASRMSRDEAAAFCAKKGGRLPTEDRSNSSGHRACIGGKEPASLPVGGNKGAVYASRGVGPLFWTLPRHAGRGAGRRRRAPRRRYPLGLHDMAGNITK